MLIDTSKIFDSIRINKQEAQERQTTALCEWPGCQNKATHPAPKGRGNARDYWHFCIEHVRKYNQSYNFFSGMDAEAVARYQRDALTGHRPTWKMGESISAHKMTGSTANFEDDWYALCTLVELNGRAGTRHRAKAKPEARKIFNVEGNALQVMGLNANATLGDIKAKYRALVKQHHPDANGGDRSTEDRLVEIIKAYQYLKTVVR
ncbi:MULTISPECIES: J domain-containing protein [unclassified Bradyrhizobium]|uniref:J domain-containing protein n=1 Tax=unclassified Bradyrhizobium TaxID=2631580 RepID=UPI0024785291|nr:MULTISPECIES: J domain-containing protein [unclassified Bradyrhizobium]WGR73069.1 J domain-containing protein [Bradyrhizobium sp. ISRA426]WGR77906.1 J domain-containing protein [Bradyrhizobium sp. ISRA430]WGR88309.1 J domain-containing protein [Bradyrhizobium sp. ISRA432]